MLECKSPGKLILLVGAEGSTPPTCAQRIGWNLACACRGWSGSKSKGLSALRNDWTEEFATASDALHRAFLRSDIAAKLREYILKALLIEVTDALASFGSSPEDVSLLVRSDARNETLAKRGQLSSHRSDATVEGVLDAAEAIFRLAPDNGHMIGIILQRDIKVVVSGHLTNE